MRSFTVLLLFVLFFSLLSGAALAQGDTLDSRWVYYGDTYEFDDVVYFVEKSGDTEKMLLYVDDAPFILKTHECKENIAAHLKYCIEEAAYEDEVEFEKYIKYEAGEELFAFHLYTYTLVPELSITRQIKPSKAEYGVRSIITVTMKNEGEKDIKNILYAEHIDDSLRLDPIDGVSEEGSFIYRKDTLVAGSSKVFQYAVVPQEYIAATLDPSVNYTYDFLKKTVDVDKLSLSVDQPFTVTTTLTSDSLAINEKATYRVTITNDADDMLVYTASLIIPEGMVVDSVKEFKRDGSQLIHEDRLRKNEEIELSFTFHTPLTGKYPFTLSIDGVVSGKKILRYYTESITTKTDELEPRIVFSKKDNKLLSGDSAIITLYLKNNEEENSFVDIKGELTSDLVTRKVSTDVVTAGEDKVIETITITAPTVETQTNKQLVFNGTYKTRNDESFTFSKKLIISLVPNTDLFTITHKPNTTTVAPGDSVKMEVTIVNAAGRYVFLNTYDTFTGNVSPYSGTTFAEISLEEDETRRVYLYEFTIPKNFTGEEILVTTHAREEQLAIVQEHTTTFTVTAADQDADTSADETTDELPEDEEEKGFFTRAWDWLTGWFS